MFNNLPKPGQLPEPASEYRGASADLAQLFASYLESGFTREEALELVKVMLQECIRRNLSD